jgi:hypothetical protein
MNHGQTLIHKIHHGPDLGDTITFPLIVYYVLSMIHCFKTWGHYIGSKDVVVWTNNVILKYFAI